MTDAEIERLNGMLPPTIRVFYCGYVRKSFHARDCASSRCYEYLLPRDALGETSVAEFDQLLRVRSAVFDPASCGVLRSGCSRVGARRVSGI